MSPKPNQPPYPKKPAPPASHKPPVPKGKIAPKLPPVNMKDSMARRMAK